jgi:hypothetical protein
MACSESGGRAEKSRCAPRASRDRGAIATGTLGCLSPRFEAADASGQELSARKEASRPMKALMMQMLPPTVAGGYADKTDLGYHRQGEIWPLQRRRPPSFMMLRDLSALSRHCSWSTLQVSSDGGDGGGGGGGCTVVVPVPCVSYESR